MADNVDVTPGSGTTIAADEVVDGTLGTVKVQYVKLMDGTLDGTTKASVSVNGLKVDPSGVTSPVSLASVPSHDVTNSGTFAVQNNAATPVGTNIIGKVGIDQTTDGTTNKVAADLRLAGTAADKGSGTGGAATQRIIIDSSQVGSLITALQAIAAGATPVALPTDQTWPRGMSPRAFAATFTTNTRPANTTAYAAGNSISNNTVAGSVTALSATVSDTNDDPITLTDILLVTTDTGAAGKRIRAYVYNSDPTANTGVGAGDGAAFANKHAGYIGSFSGMLETGFSDGAVGRLVPTFNDSAASPTPNAPAGGLIVVKPVLGAKTLFIQLQAVDSFTPVSASTWTPTVRGFQGRAS